MLHFLWQNKSSYKVKLIKSYLRLTISQISIEKWMLVKKKKKKPLISNLHLKNNINILNEKILYKKTNHIKYIYIYIYLNIRKSHLNFRLSHQNPLSQPCSLVLSWHIMSDIFKIKNKTLATLAFFIQHLTKMTILTQGWKVEDQFDTVERLGTNLT